MTDKIEICVLSSGDKPCLSVGSTVVAGAWNGRGSTVHTFRVSVEQLERLIAEHKDRNAPHTAVQLAPVPAQPAEAEGVEALATQFDGAWVPRDVLEAMAEIDVVDVDDPRGPGYTECPACGQNAQGHWEDPPHYVRPSVPHFAHCPAEFARRLRNSPESPDGSFISGEVVRIGDDRTGQPRILIHATREAIMACSENLLGKRVRVAADAARSAGGDDEA